MPRNYVPVLSKAERSARNLRVVTLLQAGKSYKEIEEIEGVAKATISNLKRYLRERGTLERKAGSGGKTPFNDRCGVNNAKHIYS